MCGSCLHGEGPSTEAVETVNRKTLEKDAGNAQHWHTYPLFIVTAFVYFSLLFLLPFFFFFDISFLSLSFSVCAFNVPSTSVESHRTAKLSVHVLSKLKRSNHLTVEESAVCCSCPFFLDGASDRARTKHPTADKTAKHAWERRKRG